MLQLQEQLERIDELKLKITDGKKFSAEHISEWKQHPITRLLMLELREKQIDALASMANIDSLHDADNLYQGYMLAFEAVLEWTPPEVEDE